MQVDVNGEGLAWKMELGPGLKKMMGVIRKERFLVIVGKE